MTSLQNDKLCDKAITYIIVTWNNEKQIEDCLSSIIKFTKVSYYIYLVDNVSSDKTLKIVKAKFPEVKIIQPGENLGFAKGNNIALKDVNTPYVCFINPDVILLEDIISPAINILENYKNVGIVASRLLNRDGSIQKSCFNFATSKNLTYEILHVGRHIRQKAPHPKFPYYYSGDKDLLPDWVIGAEMVLRTKEAKAVGGFSTDYYMYVEDMDLCKKISVELNKVVYYMANNKLIHLGGTSEAQNNSYNKQKKQFQNDLIFINKFYGRKEAQAAISSMKIAYSFRYLLLLAGYYRQDRRKQLGKTKFALSVLKTLQHS